MVLDYDFLKSLQNSSPKDAWKSIFHDVWSICSAPLSANQIDAEVTRRDRAVGEIDLFLATAGWDLWLAYEASVTRTAVALAEWWAARSSDRAVLILDALSLREAPWILQGAARHGFKIHSAIATGAELPADTTPFARSLGFGQRSSLSNNSAGSNHKLRGATTESTDIPWKDCANCIDASKDWVFWHHWPDHRLHDHDVQGKGLSTLVQEVQENLLSDDFWQLVDRLATGRRVMITSDHGYAASGLFPDSNREQTEYLKKTFKSGRWSIEDGRSSEWVPPLDLPIQTTHGQHRFVLGRRKWKSAGGYPTLTHGGMSLLEVAVPFIELSKESTKE